MAFISKWSGVIRGPACKTMSMSEQRLIFEVPPHCYHFESKQWAIQISTHSWLLAVASLMCIHAQEARGRLLIRLDSLVSELRCGMLMKVQNKASKLTFGLRSWMNSQQHKKIVSLHTYTMHCVFYYVAAKFEEAIHDIPKSFQPSGSIDQYYSTFAWRESERLLLFLSYPPPPLPSALSISRRRKKSLNLSVGHTCNYSLPVCC